MGLVLALFTRQDILYMKSLVIEYILAAEIQLLNLILPEPHFFTFHISLPAQARQQKFYLEC